MSSISSAGRIDERGYLKGFTKRGYTIPKCILELVANVLDSMDKLDARNNVLLLFLIQQTVIKMIDTAFGMDRDALDNMFAMHRENHASDSSRGISGIGAKPALSILSNKTEVLLFTRIKGGEYLCAVVPWDQIHKTGQYTGMITIRNMTEEEKLVFIQERSSQCVDKDNVHGTTVVFKYNDTLKDAIYENFLDFTPSEKSTSLTNPLDRIGCIFGREKMKIQYKHFEEDDIVLTLKTYNYFDSTYTTQADFYKGYSEHCIDHYYDGKTDRFIWIKGSQQMEINTHGKGYKTMPAPTSGNLKDFTLVGKFTVKTGCRSNPMIFNPEEPMESRFFKNENKISLSKSSAPYNMDHVGPDNLDFLNQNKLVRNNQTIGYIPSDQTVASSRANPEAFFKAILVQCEIYFNPISNQDNRQDTVTGIQENKNQFNGMAVPVTLSRLIDAIRNEKASEICNYFYKEYNKAEDAKKKAEKAAKAERDARNAEIASAEEDMDEADNETQEDEDDFVQPIPSIPEAAVEQPAIEQPAIEQPAVEQPAVEQPVEDQPLEEQPLEEQPLEEQPLEEIDGRSILATVNIAINPSAMYPLSFHMKLIELLQTI